MFKLDWRHTRQMWSRHSLVPNFTACRCVCKLGRLAASEPNTVPHVKLQQF